MSKPILTLIVVLLALALGLAAGFVIGRDSVLGSGGGSSAGVEAEAQTSLPVTVEAAEGPAGVEAQSLLPEARPEPHLMPAADSAKIEGLAFDGAAHLARLPWELDELARRAEGSDSGALVEIADWLKFCAQARGMSARPGHSELTQRGDVALVDVRSWVDGLAQECRAWVQRHALLLDAESAAAAARSTMAEGVRSGEKPSPEGVRLASDAGQILARAATADDAGARAVMRDPELKIRCNWNAPEFAGLPDRERLDAFRRCGEEERLRVLGRQLATRDPVAIAGLPEISGLGRTAFIPEDSREGTVLWTLAACAFGLDCGPSGPVLRWACIRGVCGYSSYRAYAADQLLSPAAMRRVEGLVPQLVALIRTGDWAAIARA
jgi:hypothetical protein